MHRVLPAPLLLRTSQLTYCLRTCDPAHLLPCYKTFDSLQFSTFSQLFGRQLNADAKVQAFLLVKLGGAGLLSAEQHSSAAFIASNIQSRQVVDKILSSYKARRSLHNASLLPKYSGNPTLTSEELLHSLATRQRAPSLSLPSSCRRLDQRHPLSIPWSQSRHAPLG